MNQKRSNSGLEIKRLFQTLDFKYLSQQKKLLIQ